MKFNIIKTILVVSSIMILFNGCGATRILQTKEMLKRDIQLVEKKWGEPVQIEKHPKRANRHYYYWPIIEKDDKGNNVTTGCYDKLSVNTTNNRVVGVLYYCSLLNSANNIKTDIKIRSLDLGRSTELVEAVITQDIKKAKILLEKGVSPDTVRDDLNMIDKLKVFNSITNPMSFYQNMQETKVVEDKLPILLIAARRGYKKIFKLLLDNGATVTNENLEYIMRTGNAELVGLALEKVTKVKKDILISYALKNTNIEIAKSLIQKGAKVNAKISSGKHSVTPLSALQVLLIC